MSTHEQEAQYWAFICYSHRDRQWGDWLHRSLESFRVPRRLVGRESADGTVPRRLYPVFRDREELPTSTDLGRSIRSALERSRYLIVICSPSAAASRWVNEEVRIFRRLGREHRILCFIASGEPNISESGAEHGQECFPPSLRFRLDDEGQPTNQRIEFVAADARPGCGSKSDAILKLISGLIGVGFDDLKQRDRQRRARKYAAVAAMVAIVGVILSVLWRNVTAATKSAAVEAAANEFRQASAATADGYYLKGLALAAGAIRHDSDYAPAKALIVMTLLRTRPLVHVGAPVSIRLSPDGRRIVTWTWEGLSRIWDANTGAPIGAPLPQVDVTSAEFNAGSTLIATASRDGTARFWDASTGAEMLPPLRHSAPVLSARFSPDGSRVVTRSDDRTAQVWDVATGTKLGEQLRHEDAVFTAEFNVDGTLVVTASRDGTAQIWSANTGDVLGEPLRHEAAVLSAQFSADGSRIVTASQDQTVRIWDVPTRKPVGEPLRHEQGVSSARFSPDGTRILTVPDTAWILGVRYPMGTAQLWDTRTLKRVGLPMRDASGKLSPEPLRHEEAVLSGRFDPTGRLVVTASADRTVRLWNAQTGEMVSEPMRHDEAVTSAEFTADGTRIVATSHDGTVWIWDVRTAQWAMGEDGGEPQSWFSPDGDRVVTMSENGKVQLWDTHTGKPVGRALPSADDACEVQFSDDGTRFATVWEDGRVGVRDARTGASVGKIRHDGEISCSRLSPDGTRIALASEDGAIRVLDVRTGGLVGKPVSCGSDVTTIEFSRDGTRVVAASAEGAAQVWNVNTGAPIGEPLRHEHEIYCAEFSRDGARIVTASEDGTAQVWDAHTGARMGAPLAHGGSVASARFSFDGRRIVTSGQPGPDDSWWVRAWDARTMEPISNPLFLGGDWSEEGSAEFTPDGAFIVAVWGDHEEPPVETAVWDTRTWMPVGGLLPVQARFSPDRTRLYVSSWLTSSRMWKVVDGDADDLASLAEAASGLRVSDTGALGVRTDRVDGLDALRDRFIEGSEARQLSHFDAFVRWYFADMATRPISPLWTVDRDSTP